MDRLIVLDKGHIVEQELTVSYWLKMNCVINETSKQWFPCEN